MADTTSHEILIKITVDDGEAKSGMSDFASAIAQIVTAAAGAQESNTKTADSMNEVGSSASEASGGADMLTAAITKGNIIAGVAIGALTGLMDVVTGVAESMIQAAAASTQYAAATQYSTATAQILGQQAGMSANQIDEQIASIMELSYTEQEAAAIQTTMSRLGLDTTKTMNLAAQAQNAAALMGTDAMQVFSDLTRGIMMQNQRALRNANVFMDVTSVLKAYKEEIGATNRELTQAEKAQAVLNEAIRQGESLVGVKDALAQSPKIAMDELQEDIAALQNAVGAPFLSAWTEVINVARTFVQILTSAFSEGGALYPVLINVAAALKLVAETMTNFIVPAAEGGVSVIANIANTFINAVTTAFDWGYNLIAEFASGMIDAASTALVTAINFASNLLTYFFAPGSPPRVAPDIDEWGTAAMGEFLHGFEEADWDILGNLEGPLRSIIGLLGGDNQEWAGYVGQLTQMLAEGTEVGVEFYDQIRIAAGEYGDELVALVQNQIALAEAEKEVTAAEQALADARKRESTAGAKVNADIQEYNDMLRQGATKEQLAAKMNQINASIAERDAAKEAAGEAELEIENKKEALELAKEQFDIQKRIIDQLIELANAQKEAVGAGGGGAGEGGAGDLVKKGGGGGGGGGVVAPEIGGEALAGMGQKSPLDLSSVFGDNLEEAKTAIYTKIQELWEMIKGEILAPFENLKQNAATAWAGFVEAFKASEIYIRLVEAWNTLKTWITEKVGQIGKFFTDWWAEHGDGVAALFSGIVTVVMTVVDALLPALSVIFEGLLSFFDDIGAGIGAIIELIGDWIDGVVALFTGDWDTLKQKNEEMGEDFRTFVTSIFDALIGLVQTILDAIVAIFTESEIGQKISGWFIGIWEDISTFFTEWWQGRVAEWEEFWGGVGTTLTAGGELIKIGWTEFTDWISEVWEDFVAIITDAWEGLWDDVETAFETAKNWIETTWDNLWDTVETAFETAKDWIETTWDELWAGVKEIFDTFTSDVKLAWDTFWGGVQTILTGAVSTAQTTWDNFWNGIKTTYNNIVDGIKTGWETFWTSIDEKLTTWTTNLKTAWDTFWEGFNTKFTEFVQPIIDLLTQLFDMVVPQWVKDILGMGGGLGALGGGQIPAMAGGGRVDAGETIIGGEKGPELWTATHAGSIISNDAIIRALANATNTPMATVPVTTATAGVNINIGAISISNGMELAQAEAFIIRTVRKGLAT